MKCKVIFFILLMCVSLNEAKDFVVGTRINNLLISTQKIVFRGLPLIKREKDYTYVDPKLRVIKGIIARDLSRTQAEVSVTNGGVGATNVTLHITSERGGEINYLILIFSKNT